VTTLPIGRLATDQGRDMLDTSYGNLVTLLKQSSRPQDATETIRGWLDLHRKICDSLPAEPARRLSLAQRFTSVASQLCDADRLPQEAENVCREGVPVVVTFTTKFPNEAELRRALAGLKNALGRTLQQRNHSAEAAVVFREEAALRHKLETEFGPKPDDRLQLQKTYTALGSALAASGQREQAIEAYRQALAIIEKRVPPGENDRVEVGHTLWQMGSLASDAGRQADAEKYQRRALSVFEKLAADFPQNRFYRQEQGYSDWNIAGLMQRQNRLSDAEKSFRDALDVYANLASEAPNKGVYRDREAVSRLNLAGVLVLVGRPKEAEQQYAKILEVNPKSASAHNNLAWMLATSAETKLRDPARAVVLAKKAVELEPKQGMWWNTLGAAQYRTGDWKATVEALKKSMELRHGGDSFDWFFLAMAHWQLGNKDEAR
jgi:tetratricopeptide (TPR) repeat protein